MSIFNLSVELVDMVAQSLELRDCAALRRTCRKAFNLVTQRRLHLLDVRQSALLWAAKIGRGDVAETSIRYHGKTGTADEKYYTPLMWAASRGHVQVARLLLESGADVNYNSSMLRFDAICLAIIAGHLETVELLISYGAEIGMRRSTSTYSPSPLEIAAANGMSTIVDVLLAHNAKGENLDYLSLMSGDVMTAKLCGGYRLGRIEVNAALREAVWGCNQNVLQSILQNYLDVDLEENNHFGTALQLAVLRNDFKIATILIEHGSDVNARNIQGSTALFMALRTNSLAIIELLLRKGVSLETRDDSGQTALHYALAYCPREIVRALLMAGANTDAILPNGKTAMDLLRERRGEDWMKLAQALNIPSINVFNPVE